MRWEPPEKIQAVAVDDKQTPMMCSGSWLLQRAISERCSQFSHNLTTGYEQYI